MWIIRVWAATRQSLPPQTGISWRSSKCITGRLRSSTCNSLLWSKLNYSPFHYSKLQYTFVAQKDGSVNLQEGLRQSSTLQKFICFFHHKVDVWSARSLWWLAGKARLGGQKKTYEGFFWSNKKSIKLSFKYIRRLKCWLKQKTMAEIFSERYWMLLLEPQSSRKISREEALLALPELILFSGLPLSWTEFGARPTLRLGPRGLSWLTRLKW